VKHPKYGMHKVHRTIWLSDMHLGTRGCNALKILQFLRENDAEVIYLVGDIVDGWRLSKKFFWPQTHNDIIQKLLRKVRSGTTMIWIVGNHDEFLRPYIGHRFGGIEIVDEVIHTTANGRKLLVVHGDRFDAITHNHTWIARIGDSSYDALLVANRWLMTFRRVLGYGHWSLSAYVKRRVKQAAGFISNYEQTLAGECRQRHYDGIICGHIHFAEIRMIDAVLYCNTGDFVESCTALVEDFDGNIILVQSSGDGFHPQAICTHDGQILKGETCIHWCDHSNGVSDITTDAISR
jgi:UDP-2,3-diacylglucosamine pyrophosphatase LpxH